MAAIEWFRLWHDMPNDPKWRSVARASGQPISLVLSVALHLMVDASRNVTRGHVSVTAEDIASALDVAEDAISAVLQAMQGRILEGDLLTGWERRQPKREDLGNPKSGAKSATERKREQRQREKEETETPAPNECHEVSREVTLDKDTDKDKEDKSSCRQPPADAVSCPHQEIISIYAELLPELPQVRTWEGSRATHLRARWIWALEDLKKKGKPHDRAAGLDFFRRMFGYIRDSDFLMGKAGKWQASLPWIVESENFAKIIEGNYENKEAA